MAMDDVHRFSTDEFLALDGLPRRVELVEGVICDMASEGPRHFDAQADILAALVLALPDHRVGSGGSIRVTETFCPLPDVAVYPRHRADPDEVFGADEVLLVVEVGVTSALRDRNVKLPAYATGGVAEVWLVNPLDGGLSRHREPDGGRHADVAELRWPDDLALVVDQLAARLAD